MAGIELQATMEETLPDSDTWVGRQGNGRIIYFKSSEPKRMYAKWKGKEIDAELPRNNFAFFCVSYDAIYFLSDTKIYKAVFIPPSYFAVSFVRYAIPTLTDSKEDCKLFGECLRLKDGMTYAYLMSQEPDKESIHVDLSAEEREKMQLSAVHRGKVIFSTFYEDSQDENVKILIQRSNTIVLGVFCTNRLVSYSTDSSPLVFFAYGRKIIVFDTEAMRFLPPLLIQNVEHISSVVAVHQGKLTLRVEMNDDSNCYVVTANLPPDYHRIESVANKAPVTEKMTGREIDYALAEIGARIASTEEAVNRDCSWTEFPIEQAQARMDELKKFFEPLNSIHASLVSLCENCEVTVPLLLREDRNSRNLLATARCEYNNPLSPIKLGEEVILLENSDPSKWKVQLLTGKQAVVPMWVFNRPFTYPSVDTIAIKKLQKKFEKLCASIDRRLIVILAHQFIELFKVLQTFEQTPEVSVNVWSSPHFYNSSFSGISEVIPRVYKLLGDDEVALKLSEESRRVIDYILGLFDKTATQPPNDLKAMFDGMIKDADTVRAAFEASRSAEALALPANLERNLKVSQGQKLEAVHPTGEYSSKFSKEYVVTSIRGEGGFGCVFEVFNNLDKWVYAVKRVAVNQDQVERALREVRAMAQLKHPGIVQYNFSWIEQPPEGFQRNSDVAMLKHMGLPRNHLKTALNYRDDCVFIYIQMQLCNYSLSDWLKENMQASSRNLARMKRWFKQMVSAVEYIHRSNLIHRDLKPSNVLFLENDMIKLCDLGIATHRMDDEQTESNITRTHLGTILYMSPEQRFNKPYSSKTDVFTLGLILAELVAVLASAQRTQVFDKYRLGVQSDLVADSTTANFIRLLTQVDPRDRPTCREMLDHLFLA